MNLVRLMPVVIMGTGFLDHLKLVTYEHLSSSKEFLT